MKARGARHWNYKHGWSGEPLHHVWLTMRQRCTNPRCQRYELYGARGITIDPTWEEYMTFRKWAMATGYRPGLSLDRIDNDGPYAPQNCRWATQREQMRNSSKARPITYRGRTQCLQEWAEELGVNYSTLRSRLRIGWPVARAFETPFRGQ